MFRTSRQFGRYEELLQIARQAYESRTGTELIWSHSTKAGEPEIGTLKAGIFEVHTVRCHPTDYIWILLGHDPMWAHQVVIEWMEWKIETMVQAAIDRINEPTPTEKAEAGRVFLEDFDIDNNAYSFLREITPWDRVVPNPKYDVTMLKAQLAIGQMVVKPPGPIVTADHLFPDQGPQVTSEQQLGWIQKVLENVKKNPFGVRRGA